MNPEIQQYVRVLLFTFAGSLLGKFGIAVTDDTRTALVGIVLGLGTLAWTIYGSRLNALLARVKATAGVEKVEVKIDPAIRSAGVINANTPAGVEATIAVRADAAVPKR